MVSRSPTLKRGAKKRCASGAAARRLGSGLCSVPFRCRCDANEGWLEKMKRILKSYFYWTYHRGDFHYDVMVTLILAFIFITPHLWDYGEKPSVLDFPTHPITVTSDGGRGMIITIQASDVVLSAAAPDSEVRRSLRKAVEPVAGDAVSVQRWELSRDAYGNPLAWKVWAHR